MPAIRQGSLEGSWHFEGKFTLNSDLVLYMRKQRTSLYSKTMGSSLPDCRLQAFKAKKIRNSSRLYFTFLLLLCIMAFTQVLCSAQLSHSAACISRSTRKRCKRECVFCKRSCWFLSIWGHKDGILQFKPLTCPFLEIFLCFHMKIGWYQWDLMTVFLNIPVCELCPFSFFFKVEVTRRSYLVNAFWFL